VRLLSPVVFIINSFDDNIAGDKFPFLANDKNGSFFTLRVSLLLFLLIINFSWVKSFYGT